MAISNAPAPSRIGRVPMAETSQKPVAKVPTMLPRAEAA